MERDIVYTRDGRLRRSRRALRGVFLEYGSKCPRAFFPQPRPVCRIVALAGVVKPPWQGGEILSC